MTCIGITDVLWSWGARDAVPKVGIFTTGFIRRNPGHKFDVQGVRRLNIGFGVKPCRYLDRQPTDHYA